MAVNRELLGELLKIFDVIDALKIIEDAIKLAKADKNPNDKIVEKIVENISLWEVIANYISTKHANQTISKMTQNKKPIDFSTFFNGIVEKLKKFISDSKKTETSKNEEELEIPEDEEEHETPEDEEELETSEDEEELATPKVSANIPKNLFEKINHHNKKLYVLSYDAQYKLLQEVYKIVGEDLFWNNVKKTIQKPELKDKQIGSIFCYYQPEIEPSYCLADSIIIADKNDYILESKGHIDAWGAKTKFYLFNETTFRLEETENRAKNIDLANYKTKKFYYFNAMIVHTNFQIYDISLLYPKILTVLNNLIKITSYYGTDSEILNVNQDLEKSYIPITTDCNKLHNFIKEICSVKLLNNEPSTMFASKNLVIYTFLFANRIDMLLDLLKTRLSLPNLDHSNITVDPQTVNDQSKILFGANKANLDVKAYIFNKLFESNNIMMFIKTYNYLSMTEFSNELNYKILPDSPANVLVIFCKKIDEFLTKCSEMSSFLENMKVGEPNDKVSEPNDKVSEPNDEVSVPNDIVTSFVLSYIFDILREKNNIPFNKIRIVDNMTDYKRNLSDPELTIITSNVQHLYNWLNKSSTNKMKRMYQIMQQTTITLNDETYPNCGESTILNLLNYCLLSQYDDSFQIEKFDKFGEVKQELIDFYNKYKNMKIMLEKYSEAVIEWAKLMNDLEGVGYHHTSKKCEINPDIENVNKIMNKLLNIAPKSGNESSVENIKNIILKLDSDINVSIDTAITRYVRITLDSGYIAKFNSTHADMDAVTHGKFVSGEVTDTYIKIEPEYNKIFNKNVDIFTKISLNKSYENLDVNKLKAILIDNLSTDKVSLDNNSLTYKLFMFIDMNERDVVEDFIVACGKTDPEILMIFIKFIFRIYEKANFYEMNFKNFRSTTCHIIENAIDEKKYKSLHDFVEIISMHSKNMVNIIDQRDLNDSLKILTHLNMVVDFLIKIYETSEDLYHVDTALKEIYGKICDVVQKK